MLKKFNIKYDKQKFWENNWRDFEVDKKYFSNLEIYPIKYILKHIKKNHKILECGFGAGRVIRHLHHNNYDITGIEKDPSIVSRLSAVDPDLKIFVGDLNNFNNYEDKFDIILCFGVIGTIEDIDIAIKNLKKILKPDGKLIISSIYKNFARYLQKIIQNFKNFKKEDNFYSWIGDKNDWQNFYSNNKFETIEYSYVNSQYIIYYWLPILRSKNLITDARVTDNYKLNIFGKLIWLIISKFFSKQFSMGILFVLRNNK